MREILKKNVNVLDVAEIIIDAGFLSGQLLPEGYYHSNSLDIFNKSEG